MLLTTQPDLMDIIGYIWMWTLFSLKKCLSNKSVDKIWKDTSRIVPPFGKSVLRVKLLAYLNDHSHLLSRHKFNLSPINNIFKVFRFNFNHIHAAFCTNCTFVQLVNWYVPFPRVMNFRFLSPYNMSIEYDLTRRSVINHFQRNTTIKLS